MSTDHPSGGTAAVVPAEAPQPISRRRIDQIDEPARPLGEKRAALHARKRSASPPGSASIARWTRPGERVLASIDASIKFSLRPTPGGLVLERTQQHRAGACLVQTMVFQDEGRFERWCASEPVRFDEPVLYDQLRREGHEAFGRKW